ncbi:MAG: 50S ribosomal protein L30 [Nitrospira sp. LK265]|nr:50S ribosomal protein L30 [Nitrospira sp. LK265]
MGSAKTSTASKDDVQTVRVTLRRSPIGTPERHRLVLRSLGLRRIRQTVVHPDSPQVRGMIRKVGYLLEIGTP